MNYFLIYRYKLLQSPPSKPNRVFADPPSRGGVVPPGLHVHQPGRRVGVVARVAAEAERGEARGTRGGLGAGVGRVAGQAEAHVQAGHARAGGREHGAGATQLQRDVVRQVKNIILDYD